MAKNKIYHCYYYNMAKMSNTEFVLTCVVSVIIIMVALYFGTADLQPFEGTSKGLKEYPYEGFENAVKAFDNRNSKETPLENFTEMPEKKKDGKPVEGFSGLMGSALAESNQPMGFLAMNEGSKSCPGYGYTKSTGNVCFSPADVQLMYTRGGNATGM